MNLLRISLKAVAILIAALPFALAAYVLSRSVSLAIVSPEGTLWIAAALAVPLIVAYVLWRLAGLIR